VRAWIEVPEERWARDAVTGAWEPLKEIVLGLAHMVDEYPDQYPSDKALAEITVRALHILQGLSTGDRYACGDELYGKPIEPRIRPDVEMLREVIRVNSRG
jgi:hypothetical protein